MKKTVYVVLPYMDKVEDVKNVVEDARTRLTQTFSEDELNFVTVMPTSNDRDNEFECLIDFLKVIIAVPDIIFFFAGNFVDDSFCMSAMTICKMYSVAAMLDKRIVEADYKKDLENAKNTTP